MNVIVGLRRLVLHHQVIRTGRSLPTGTLSVAHRRAATDQNFPVPPAPPEATSSSLKVLHRSAGHTLGCTSVSASLIVTAIGFRSPAKAAAPIRVASNGIVRLPQKDPLPSVLLNHRRPRSETGAGRSRDLSSGLQETVHYSSAEGELKAATNRSNPARTSFTSLSEPPSATRRQKSKIDSTNLGDFGRLESLTGKPSASWSSCRLRRNLESNSDLRDQAKALQQMTARHAARGRPGPPDVQSSRCAHDESLLAPGVRRDACDRQVDFDQPLRILEASLTARPLRSSSLSTWYCSTLTIGSHPSLAGFWMV